jgi:hypothetical protein
MRARLALARAEALGLRGPKDARRRVVKRLPFPSHLGGIRVLSEQTSIPTATLQHWFTYGCDVFQADRLAVALGTVPHRIWSEYRYLDDAMALADPFAPEHQILDAPGGRPHRRAA